MSKRKHNYGGTSQYDEAIRTLRTNILFSNIDEKLKSIVITSSVPDEGKTTVSIELCRSLAQNGNKVLLMDMDLRNPSVAGALGLENRVGITNILMKKISLEQAIIEDEYEEDLNFLVTGPLPPNPAELIASDAVKELVDEVYRKFDYVIIDTPPVGIITDAAIISTLADGVILIIKSESTKKELVEKSIESIHKVNGKILGAVLTHAKVKGREYGSYYGK